MNIKPNTIIAMIICFISIVLIGCDGSINKTSSNSSVAETATDDNARKAKKVLNEFRPMRVRDGILYVPKTGFKQLDVPKPYSNGGTLLFGTVEKDVDDPKELNLYNIHVAFGKDETIKSIKPEEEEMVLNNAFDSFWSNLKNNVKVATKQELISKEFCTNMHGKKYLKFTHISGNPNRPKNDSLCKSAIYIFGDTGYFIDVSAMKNFAKKYEEEFDLILDSFSVEGISLKETSSINNVQQDLPIKDNSKASVNQIRKGIITGTDVLMRSGPGKQYQSIGVFEQGEDVKILEEQQSWLKVQSAKKNIPVWVFKHYCSEYIGDRQMPNKIILHQTYDGEASVDILKCIVSPKRNLKIYEKADEGSKIIDTMSIGNYYSIIDFELHTYPTNNVYTMSTGETVRLLTYRGEGYYSIFNNGIIREVEMQTNQLELKRWPDFWLCLKVSGNKNGWVIVKTVEDFLSEKGSGIFLSRPKL